MNCFGSGEKRNLHNYGTVVCLFVFKWTKFELCSNFFPINMLHLKNCGCISFSETFSYNLSCWKFLETSLTCHHIYLFGSKGTPSQ